MANLSFKEERGLIWNKVLSFDLPYYLKDGSSVPEQIVYFDNRGILTERRDTLIKWSEIKIDEVFEAPF